MRVNLPKKLVIGASLVAIVGVLLGAYFAVKKDIGSVNKDPVPVATVSSNDGSNNFGTYFNNVFLGRSGDGSKIKSNTPLVKSSKFYVGERAGVRVETAAGLMSPITVEVRFLKTDTGEETPALQKMRQNISVKPGLKSYCCITMPKEAGSISVQIVLRGVFLGSIGNFTILPAKTLDQGGFFSV
jgi:hypothetical protein